MTSHFPSFPRKRQQINTQRSELMSHPPSQIIGPFVPSRAPPQMINAHSAASLVTGAGLASNSLERRKSLSRMPFVSPDSPGRASFMHVTAPRQRAPRNNEVTDVAAAQRSGRSAEVRQKFCDIFEVSDCCENFGDPDIENVSNDFSVAGRLGKDRVPFFKAIGACKLVLDTLEFGHKPFLSGEVPRYDRGNNKSYYEHIDFAAGEIESLIKSKKVEIVQEKPRMINPLSVALQPSKKRLVLDCSFLNTFVVVPPFKMDDVKTGLSFFKKEAYMIGFDLKDGYHHIAIHEEFRDYLGFSFLREGKVTYARFVVAPFGLRDVPYLFTKILRPLVAHWRRLGFECCVYLDDGFSSMAEMERAVEASVHIRKDLIRAGLVWSIKKSSWEPRQEIDWIGFIWNSITGTLRIRERRITKLKETCSSLLAQTSCPARRLAGFVGQVISMSVVLGDVARLKSRNAQIWVALAKSWDDGVWLRDSIKSELRFWLSNIDRLNEHDCFPLAGPVCIDLIEGDASGTGCGSILNRGVIAARKFSEEERAESSTWRELANIHLALHSFLPRISHRTVKFRTDSQSAAKICRVGSMNCFLQCMAEDIFELCLKHKIGLVVEWIPRSENQLADAISRMAEAIDIDDWGITAEFANILNSRMGPFSIDLFANYYNAKCERFYSLFLCPGSLGVDALAHSWEGECGLMVPPIDLIPRALSHAKLCKCSVVLVAPLWSSSPFWPVVRNSYLQYLTDILVVKGSKVLEQGLNKNAIFGSNSFTGEVIAIKFSF